ncbi:MAG: anion transporter [Bacteroidetes bacterium]|nr:anion transporter [Bacteroidota bacterium]MCL5035387.1 anion transporter [Bacteroidota bacterium]
MALIAVIIFGFTYLTISVQRLPYFHLDRTSGAMIGAVAMIAFGVLTINDAYQSLNLDTIVLLLGMMIVVAYLQVSGFFDLVASSVLRRARTGNGLLLTVILSAGILSALFVNDTICVMMTPFVLLLTSRSKVDPKPYLIALASSANIGSVATLVGNPQNMLVGTFSHWPYLGFLIAMLPIAIGGLLINFFLLKFFFRERLNHALTLDGMTERHKLDKPLLYKSVVVMSVVLIGFSAGVELSFMAILGAALLILVANRRPDEIFAKVNWSLLLFFASLFVVVGGINKVGLVQDAHRMLQGYFSISTFQQITSFSFASLIISNIVSNVPYVMIVRHWVASFNSPSLMWLVLAMSSTFAGNLTVAGSVANMIVLELSKERAPFRFWEFTRVSAAIALVTWAFGTLLLVAYAAVGRF